MFTHSLISCPLTFYLQEKSVKDNVWFTYKARIQAHKRLEWLDIHSQFLLVWYAILGAVLAIVAIRYPQALGANTDILAAVLSVALLGVSLAVANRDFRGRALTMMKNYKDLQKLYNLLNSAASVTEAHSNAYHDLLAESENHKEIDDRRFRTSASSTLLSRKPTKFDFVCVYCWLAIRALITSALYLGPIAIAWHLK